MSHAFDEFEEQLDVGLIFQKNTTAEASKRLLKYEKICAIMNDMRKAASPDSGRTVEHRGNTADITVKTPKKIGGGSSPQQVYVYYT